MSSSITDQATSARPSEQSPEQEQTARDYQARIAGLMESLGAAMPGLLRRAVAVEGCRHGARAVDALLLADAVGELGGGEGDRLLKKVRIVPFFFFF